MVVTWWILAFLRSDVSYQAMLSVSSDPCYVYVHAARVYYITMTSDVISGQRRHNLKPRITPVSRLNHDARLVDDEGYDVTK